MQAKGGMSPELLKIHGIGGGLCVLIAGCAIFFAGSSITKRRGLFLSARQELASTKTQLNEAVRQRGVLASRVQRLEQLTREDLDLVSVRRLNARTADIVALAERADVTIDSLQPQERILDARVPVQPLDLVGSAGADSVVAFLGALGEEMPDIHVQMVMLTSGSFESSVVDLRLQLFWFVDPADADQ